MTNFRKRSAAPPPTPGRRRRGLSRLQAALAGAVVIGIACYLVFGGSLPWAGSPFVLKAAFTANTELHIPSPVRIAGADVGEVTGVRHIPGSADAGIVTMQLNSGALPVHSDATVAIRARTFLEGNFYVALEPGSPRAPVLHSGATLPAANTSGPVQLDRILSSLTSPARANLQTDLRGLGSALSDGGGTALNQTLRYSTAALESSAIVNRAMLGEQPHDLSGAIAGSAKVLEGLSAAPDQLTGLVNGFQQTMSTLASRQQQLAATIAALPSLLQATDRADVQLQRSLPVLRTFSTELIPGLHQLAPTIAVALPWVRQLTALAGSSELGGLLHSLTPAVQSLNRASSPARQLLTEAEQLGRCVSDDLVPTGNQTISDPPQQTTQKLYQELFQSAVGVASAAQDFDGNGRYVRASTGGGGTLVKTKPLPVNGPLYGNAVLPSLGARPALPARRPATNASRACYRNAAPDLNAAATGVGP